MRTFFVSALACSVTLVPVGALAQTQGGPGGATGTQVNPAATGSVEPSGPQGGAGRDKCEMKWGPKGDWSRESDMSGECPHHCGRFGEHEAGCAPGAMRHGMMAEAAMPGERKFWHGPEVRYLTGLEMGTNGSPGVTAIATPTLLLARDHRFAIFNWLSVGHEGNLGLQLTSNSPWVSSYDGIMPRLGFGLGPVRLDVGALAGLGAMVRTARVGSTADLLQLRAMWVLEPRVELGLQGGKVSGGLVASYLITPNPADLGGVTLGLRIGFGSKVPGKLGRGEHERFHRGMNEPGCRMEGGPSPAPSPNP